jgi:hypothetical protein
MSITSTDTSDDISVNKKQPLPLDENTSRKIKVYKKKIVDFLLFLFFPGIHKY